jgi:hypothetical protein
VCSFLDITSLRNDVLLSVRNAFFDKERWNYIIYRLVTKFQGTGNVCLRQVILSSDKTAEITTVPM